MPSSEEDREIARGSWDKRDDAETKSEGQRLFDALARHFDQCVFVGCREGDGSDVSLAAIGAPGHANFALFRTGDDVIVAFLVTKVLEILAGDAAALEDDAEFEAIALELVQPLANIAAKVSQRLAKSDPAPGLDPRDFSRFLEQRRGFNA